MPPATYTSPSPALIDAAASMIALRPEPQTRLIVVAGVVSARPASSSAFRAGAWPAPAWSTWPMNTSSIGASAGRPERSTAARIAVAPSVVGGHAREHAAELADRRPGGADEVDVSVRTGCRLLHAAEGTPCLRRRPGTRRPGAAARRRMRSTDLPPGGPPDARRR